MSTATVHASPKPQIGQITVPHIWTCLKAGVHDFVRAPAYGVFFAAFYAILGNVLIVVGAGTFLWTLALALGFPLVAPFAAVGFYEVSRRLELGLPLDRSAILGVVWSERRRQLPWIGVVLALIFLFWSFFAHMLVALFLGVSSVGNTSLDTFMATQDGQMLLAVQFVVGAAVAFLTYGLTAVSLPLLVDKEIDFVSAMILSLKTVHANKATMGLWAVLIAAALFLAMLPAFLGLFIVLPVLGHATWHIYRRALVHPTS